MSDRNPLHAGLELTTADYRRLVAFAPDDMPVRMPPWAGGTWHGTCGATLWMSEGATLPTMTWEKNVDNKYVQRAGRFDPLPHDAPARKAGGFRVECDQKFRHEGDHASGPITWHDDPLVHGYMTRMS